MTNPSEEADFRGRVQKLEGLLREIEAFVDPVQRSTALEAVQTLMEFHGAAVGKIVDHLAAAPEGGAILARLSNDDLVSSLLLLYGLHPADFESRVRQALDKARPIVKTNAGTIELVGINDGAVRVRVERTGHACGSSAGKIKAAIEDAIFERAPEVTAIEIDGLAPAASSGFVPVEQLLGHRSAQGKSKTGDSHDSQTAAASGACAGVE
ncbi:MAG TPA: NifU family protein [Tepidisphaeraceae bacterium]|jgi:Fe-S cluster biogenesis protein NfuA|nr:NifU family protein [Tepidisphaeraceae bacterium]